MNIESRRALRELLEAGLDGWHTVDNDAEHARGQFDELVKNGFARSKSGGGYINKQWYPSTLYQITEEGLSELDYEVCHNCEGDGIDYIDHMEVDCQTCKGKGYILTKPHDPCAEIKADLDTARRTQEVMQSTITALEAENEQLKATFYALMYRFS